MRLGPASILACLLFSTAPCAAALYEFTLEGTVTYSLFGFDPAVGEPCVIRFLADDQDLDPDPRYGAFDVTSPVVTFPLSNVPFDFEPVFRKRFVVNNGNVSGTGTDFVAYESEGVIGSSWNFRFSLVFPDGIIQSDALPLTSPLMDAISTKFLISISSTDVVWGKITSYTGVPVPEGSQLSAVFAFCAGLEIRRRGQCDQRSGRESAYRSGD